MMSINFEALLHQLVYDPAHPLLPSNGVFVFLFSVFIFLYYLLRNRLRMRRYVFCLFSLYFFYKASGIFVLLVIFSAVFDYLLSNAIYRTKAGKGRLLLLLLSILFNLGMLVYFKYTDFFIACSNNFFQTNFNPLNLILPIGISFFTFENLSYTIDVYRGEFKPVRHFSEYLLFLSFFPKLVMGPIVRANDFIPQINKPYVISNADMVQGFFLIITGMFKKLIISDYLTLNFVDYVFDDPMRYSGLENLMAVYGYAFVIYCDFSGYSDLARGIAQWLGFSIPNNFLSPYQSKSITEFWRRWHISLSSWLKDYLYIPLGGNRKFSPAAVLIGLLLLAGCFAGSRYLLHLNIWKSASIAGLLLLVLILPAILTGSREKFAANLNLSATMLLGGFWHGASWNFIIWGGLNGLGLALHKMWLQLVGSRLEAAGQRWWYRAFSVFLCFHFVCFCWVFFKSADFERAEQMLSQIFLHFNPDLFLSFISNYKPVMAVLLLAAALHSIPDRWINLQLARLGHVAIWVYVLVFFLFLLLYGFFKSSEPILPIYLKF